uniref:Uncharacterized protein n=1 Tax=uncultured marine virus TaxID=186617 RepID=A0A0F7L5D2_9VIRU|nr:hypothetical protein [uncultured marine virus]
MCIQMFRVPCSFSYLFVLLFFQTFASVLIAYLKASCQTFFAYILDGSLSDFPHLKLSIVNGNILTMSSFVLAISKICSICFIACIMVSK